MTPVKIWIDATEFENKGGWKLDTQFVHLMGSGYLIAADMPGVPVEDASVDVTIPKQGHYRIWVWDRNWLRPHDPGQFTVLVDGKDTGNVLGKIPSDKWLWEIAGDVELTEGTHTLFLHDLTGYFGRCASVLITDDFDYVPSRELEWIYAERAKIKGLSNEVSEGGTYDVIVAGGGPGGVPAAIASARKGMKTLLLQNRPMLGGNASSEVGITMDGAEVAHINAREGGIAEEIRRLRDRDPSFQGDWTRAMETLTAVEPNLTVMCNMHVCQAEMTNAAKIRSVVARNMQDLTRTRFAAKIFIDCTGDSWLGYYAGAKYRYGREATWQHNESIAPELADMLTMSGCIKSGNRPFFFQSEIPVEYHAPVWVPALPTDDKTFGRNITGNGGSMYWWLEAPNVYDDMWDGEEARDALLMAILGYYDHIKNHWSGKEKAQNLLFRFTSVFNGRRESRRLIGDYVLTQEDCFKTEPFPDAVSYAGWHLDVHHPEGLYSGEKGPMHCAFHVPLPTIPFRCLYSVNIDNLLFAGRNISVSHVALGTVRVENTIATFGQAVGTAAAMCVQLDKTPRQIGQQHIRQLQQQLIRDDQFIPGFKNEDETDPCLTATATASSVKTDEIFQTLQGVDGELLPLDVDRIMNYCVESSHGDIHSLWVKLHNANNTPTTITMHAYTQGHSLDSFAEQKEIFTAHSVVPAAGESWVKVPIYIPIPRNERIDRCYMRIWIDAAEGISWRSATNRSFYQVAGHRDPDGNWKTGSAWTYRCTHMEPVEEIANCSPANVINGHSRILDAQRYEWVSDPKEAFPQWLELTLQEKTQIHSVSIVFDTDMTNPGTCWHADSKAPGVATCVKDYTVEIFDGNNWVCVADIKENFMRKRNHDFDAITAKKIRINVHSTWGNASARIMEVRCSILK